MNTRSLNDRVAEAMRRERLGLIRPLWADFSDDSKADWLNRADHLIRLLRELDVFVALEQEVKRRAKA
jgi:hypothetical protein